MNEKQKKYVIKSVVGYGAALLMFGTIYFFQDPMPAIIAIMIIVMLFGGKEYQYNKEMAEKNMAEFIEYSKRHKFILTTIAGYSVVLPILLFVLSKKNYITIGSDAKSLTKYGLLTALPFFLFDIGHRVYICKKYESLTEHATQGDPE